MQLVPPFLPPAKRLLFLRGQFCFPERGGYVSAHKIEVDFNRLCGVLASFAVALMDKDFIDKFIEHSVRHGVEALVFVNQSDKLFRRFLALVVAADGLFQLRNLDGPFFLLFGVLCLQLLPMAL